MYEQNVKFYCFNWFNSKKGMYNLETLAPKQMSFWLFGPLTHKNQHITLYNILFGKSFLLIWLKQREESPLIQYLLMMINHLSSIRSVETQLMDYRPTSAAQVTVSTHLSCCRHYLLTLLIVVTNNTCT